RGRLGEALVQYDKARGLDPGYTEAELNRAYTFLRLGDYAKGWPGYESRWSVPGRSTKKPDSPEWAGEDYRGSRLLVYAEQGQGDMIMCLRYLPLAKERGGELLVECWPPLRRLVERVPGVDRLWARGEERPSFDLACPMMSLPRWFTTDVASIPGTVPYITTPPGLGAKFEPFLARAEGRLKVGLAWAGNAKFKADHERSLRLASLLSHFALPGLALYSLQKGPPVIELKTVAPDAPIIDLAPHLKDFADTAAAIEGLDLVITVDTSVAHLAGALARPTWTMLPHVADWRWLTEADDTRWYPTMRLFRQPAPCEWGPVLRAVRDELARVAAGDRARLLPTFRC
ncbi:MAG: glycosyltransferase family 9 protein, partial [Alphaproteobacteria bacterium]